MNIRWLLTLFLCWLPNALVAAPTQDLNQLQELVAQFIAQQTQGINGEVGYQVSPVDTRLSLAKCSKPEVFLPNGAQLVGRVSIGVRCNKPERWQIFIPATIQLKLNLVISARPLTRNIPLSSDDLNIQTTEVTRATGFTDPEQIIGKVLKYNITQGQIIREDMLRAAYSITQGQITPIIIEGDGFSIRSEGTALNNASAGQRAQLRTSNGKVVSGIATEDGTLKVNP